MTNQQLEANAETPMDFTVHLAERLQLAPESAAAQLEAWLVDYPRVHRAVPGEHAPELDGASDRPQHALAG